MIIKESTHHVQKEQDIQNKAGYLLGLHIFVFQAQIVFEILILMSGKQIDGFSLCSRCKCLSTYSHNNKYHTYASK